MRSKGKKLCSCTEECICKAARGFPCSYLIPVPIYLSCITKTPAQHLACDALSEDLPCSVTCRYGIAVHALCSGLHFQTSATITWKCWPYCLKQIARKNFSYIFKECLRLVLKVQQRLKLAYVVCKTALPHSGEKTVEGILHCLVLRQRK